RDGVDEVHRDDRLAGHGEALPPGSINGHNRSIGIRDFDKRHEFFETLGPLSRALVMCQARYYLLGTAGIAIQASGKSSNYWPESPGQSCNATQITASGEEPCLPTASTSYSRTAPGSTDRAGAR